MPCPAATLGTLSLTASHLAFSPILSAFALPLPTHPQSPICLTAPCPLHTQRNSPSAPTVLPSHPLQLQPASILLPPISGLGIGNVGMRVMGSGVGRNAQGYGT
ncbi:hypothetical protein K439DRAFT_1618259 [Ramaria rubella]|nr:hypothetical protein K439DRAFT_1618259 [Ramaria rubella]